MLELFSSGDNILVYGKLLVWCRVLFETHLVSFVKFLKLYDTEAGCPLVHKLFIIRINFAGYKNCQSLTDFTQNCMNSQLEL